MSDPARTGRVRRFPGGWSARRVGVQMTGKNWVVGILSLVPGLGFLFLGEPRKAGWSFLFTVTPAALLLAPWETVAITGAVLGLTAWITQGYLAVLAARTKEEAGTNLASRPDSQPRSFPGSTRSERAVLQASASLAPHCQEDERLLLGLHAIAGEESFSLLPFVLSVLGGYDPGLSPQAQFYLGVTDRNLLFARLDALGDVEHVERVPLAHLSGIDINERTFTDVLSIGIDGRPPRLFRFGWPVRAWTRHFVALLCGLEHSPPVGKKTGYSERIRIVGAQTRVSPSLFQHMGVFAASLLCGYGGGYIAFSRVFLPDPGLGWLIQDVVLQACCCLPIAAPLVVVIPRMLMNRWKDRQLSARRRLVYNGVAGLLIGLTGYVPFQLLLILGAAL